MDIAAPTRPSWWTPEYEARKFWLVQTAPPLTGWQRQGLRDAFSTLDATGAQADAR
jgi:hypothetical protein